MWFTWMKAVAFPVLLAQTVAINVKVEHFSSATSPLLQSPGKFTIHECTLKIEQPVYDFQINLTTNIPTTLELFGDDLFMEIQSGSWYIFINEATRFPPTVRIWFEFERESSSRIEGACYWTDVVTTPPNENTTVSRQEWNVSTTPHVTTTEAQQITSLNGSLLTTGTEHTTKMTVYDTNLLLGSDNGTQFGPNDTQSPSSGDSEVTITFADNPINFSVKATTEPTHTNMTTSSTNVTDSPEATIGEHSNKTDVLYTNITMSTQQTMAKTTKPMCLCQCPCKPIDLKDVDAILHEMIEGLQIQKNSTSLAKRKKLSAPDQRWLSRGIGCVGVLVLTIVFGLLLVGDTKVFIRDAKLIIHDLREHFRRLH